MKRAKTYYATRGGLQMDGASKAEAKANLDSAIDWVCDNSSSHLETRFGFVISVSPNVYGYETRVFNPADLQHGKPYNSSCQQGRVSRVDAIDSARSHAAQNAWNPEITNDSEFLEMAGLTPSKAGELARWIRFQRSYIELAKAGHTPNDCHRLACESSYQESAQ